MFKWIITCISLAAVAGILWALGISDPIGAIAPTACIALLVAALVLLLLDRR